MTNLDLILGSIKTKAEEEKNQILEEAKKEADQILNEAKEKAKGEAETIMKDAEKESKLVLDNEKLSSSRKARDIKIKAKNELIDEVLAKVLDKLKDRKSVV